MSLRISLCKGRHREGALDCAERVRCPRAERHTPFPGGFGHHLAGTTTGPWGAPLDWDRRGRVTPASTASDAASGRRIVTDRRSRHVPGNLASSRAQRAKARKSEPRWNADRRACCAISTRPCQLHGRLEQASVGVPLPFFLSLFCAVRSQASLPGLTRQSMRKRNDINLPVASRKPRVTMDHRVKPGGDEVEYCAR
jgi:hypothetical protein